MHTTAIYVTHDQIEAMTMADKMVILQNGNIVQQGAPLDVYDNPDNLFVAGFIGSPAMNFLPGTWHPNERDGSVRFDQGGLLPVGNMRAAANQRVIFGMRPEHIELVSEGQGLSCIVKVVEPTGATTELYCMHGNTEICVILPSRRAIEPGSVVHLAPRHGQAFLFDANSTQRLYPRGEEVTEWKSAHASV